MYELDETGPAASTSARIARHNPRPGIPCKFALIVELPTYFIIEGQAYLEWAKFANTYCKTRYYMNMPHCLSKELLDGHTRE